MSGLDPRSSQARNHNGGSWKNPHKIHGYKVKPIRYASIGPLSFNFWMEETQAKADLRERS